MGDRVVFVFKSGDQVSPGVYSHWLGSEAPTLLQQAGEAGILRGGDPFYAAARMCGFLHEQSPRSTTGLGLLHLPPALDPVALAEYSHGDAGVVIVEVGDYGETEGKIEYSHGYLADETDLPKTVRLSA